MSSTLAGRRDALNAMRHARALRRAEERLPFAELVRRAQSDSNGAMAPKRDAVLRRGSSVFDQTITRLRETRPPRGPEVLIPAYTHPVEASGRGMAEDMGAWLPQDFAQHATEVLKNHFELERLPGDAAEGGMLLFLPLVDKSYSAHANNEALAAVGSLVLHLYARSACLVQLDASLGASHQEAALHLLSDRNLSKVFRAVPPAKHVLTCMDTARKLQGHCYYGTSLGADLVAHYPGGGGEGGAADVEAEQDATEVRVFSAALKAVVGHVYLEKGFDAAVFLLEEAFIGKLLAQVRAVANSK